jgi:hypothetical protein
MSFSNLCGLGDIELYFSFEGERLEFDHLVVTHIKPEVNAFVDGEACDQTVLVVDVCAKRAYTIGTENVVFGITHCIGFTCCG